MYVLLILHSIMFPLAFVLGVASSALSDNVSLSSLAFRNIVEDFCLSPDTDLRSATTDKLDSCTSDQQRQTNTPHTSKHLGL